MLRSVIVSTITVLSLLSVAGADEGVVSSQKIKLNALAQAWGVNDNTDATGVLTTFRMRRTEIKFSGDAAPNTKWFVMADFAKAISATDASPLQDLGVSYSLTDSLEFTMGEFKIPTIAESLDSSAKLNFAERSYVARFFGERRDPGFMVTFKATDNISLRAMASNGLDAAGAKGLVNQNDNNTGKDSSGRLDVGLPDQNLKLGLFASSSIFGAPGAEKSRNHGGADLKWTSERLYLSLATVSGKMTDKNTSGSVAEVVYTLMDSVQFGVRLDTITNQNKFEEASSGTTAGLTYLPDPKGGSRIQLSYTALKNMTGKFGAYEQSKGTDGGVSILNFQAAL